MIPHPTDNYKYVVCEYISVGHKKGWSIHIMSCAPGKRWHQSTQNCIQDDKPTTQEPETATPVVTKVLPDGHLIRCFNQGKFPHPTDKHKYVVFEYVAVDPYKGWWIHIVGCAPGTIWHQQFQDCIADDEPTTQEPETASPFLINVLPDGHRIRCYTQGMIPHPTDRYKYLTCEYISDGSNKGWHINIMNCAPGTRWYQPTQICIKNDEPTTQEPETASPVLTKVLPDGHRIRCYTQGMIPHLTDRYKYVVCEYIPEGNNKG
jgi:hypothetical protein